MGVLVLAGTVVNLRALSAGALLAGLLLQVGIAAALWHSHLLVLPEPLTGGLIALSVLVFLQGWRATSVLLGTAALFVRELAGPYVGIRLVWAIGCASGARPSGWALGIGAYGLYFLLHIGQVHQAMPPDPTSGTPIHGCSSGACVSCSRPCAQMPG